MKLAMRKGAVLLLLRLSAFLSSPISLGKRTYYIRTYVYSPVDTGSNSFSQVYPKLPLVICRHQLLQLSPITSHSKLFVVVILQAFQVKVPGESTAIYIESFYDLVPIGTTIDHQ